mgnify:CR=1 FL=1
MAIDSYSNLKTAIANWTLRTDLTPYLDDFIDLTENMFKREPSPPNEPSVGGIRGKIKRATGTLTAGTDTLAIPSDFQEIYRFTLTADSNFTVLRFADRTMIDLYHRAGSGTPEYFTIADTFQFDTNPDSNYDYQIMYYEAPTALSDSNTSNWVLAEYPDVYLSGCLFYAHRFIHDDEKAATYLSQYQSLAWSASETYRGSRDSQGSIAITVDSVTP